VGSVPPPARVPASSGAALAAPSPPRRLAAWLYTGPLGHLWSTTADIASLWLRWSAGRARERLRGRRTP
jgi:hypothetical protein